MTFRLLLLMALSLAGSSASAVTLELWNAWPSADGTMRALAYRYTQQTGVNIRIRTIRTTGRITWSSSGGPDMAVLYRPTKPGIQYMASRGQIQDIRVDMSRGWYALFWPALLDTFSVRSTRGAGIYGVPLTAQVHVFIYNRQIFQKAGVGVPRSWAQLMAVSQRLRRIGVTPYAGGFGSDKPPLAAVYEYAYLGSHLLVQTYTGHYPYTASQWLANLNLYSEMRRYGFTTAASARLSEAAATKQFLDGRVAMVFVDTAFEQIRRSYKPTFTAFGAFDPPDDPRARFLNKLPGAVEAGLVINSRSPRRVQAIAFARWLTEYNQQMTLGAGSVSVPAMTVASNSGRLPYTLQLIASAGVRDMASDLRIYESPKVLATFYSGVGGILAGTSTPSSTASRTQRAKAGR